MKLLSEIYPLILSLTFLLHAGFSRGAEPTIVWKDDDDSFGTNSDRADNMPKIPTFSALTHLKDCRDAGFDPMQLACTTCSILPEQHQGTCQECCQSYKSLEKRTKRYEMAILFNTGFPESVQELIRDDKDTILEQKGSARFHVHDLAVNREMMAMMGMFQQQPSAILWFDKLIDIDSNPDENELASQADEITVLSGRGLGRDDTRDMLLTLLPDKVTQ